jgi:hypothetical protein
MSGEFHLNSQQQAISGEIWKLARRAWEESQAQYEAAKPWVIAEYTTIIGGVLVGVLAGLGAFSDRVNHTVVGWTVILAAILGATSLVLKSLGLARKHHGAGNDYGSVRREATSYCEMTLPYVSVEEAQARYRELVARYEAIGHGAPPASNRARKRGLLLIAADDPYSIGPPIEILNLPGPNDRPGP